MKAIKLLFFSLMCLMAVAGQAQRIAVVGFKAGANVSLADIDGISETFSTYFQPKGYTPVDRLYIDKALAEQRIQRSSITEEQAVKAGKVMNVSKIVVGKVHVSFDGGYQVDVVVLDVESGLPVAKDGITVAKGSYRQNIQTLATILAGKITPNGSGGGMKFKKPRPDTYDSTVPTSTSQPVSAQERTKVDTLYGYLKIFPNELGTFEAEPTSVIGHINEQAMYGYNNWRIPTNEELSLMRANNYLGSGEYMTQESKHGIVLLVSDGEDYATLQAEEQQSYVDLGLPSGTKWKDKNEEGGFYTYEEAVSKFGNKLPTKVQFEELLNSCTWSWTGSGYKVTGPNGQSITLPAAGDRGCDGDGDVYGVGSSGGYWSSTPSDSDNAWYLGFYSGSCRMYNFYSRCFGRSVRLVQGQ